MRNGASRRDQAVEHRQGVVRIGTAGWALPADPRHFPAEGTHLQRYAAVFNAVEINSSFYRPHRASSYARWAESVPDDFRFSVKMPKAMTHEMRLAGCAAALDEFLAPVRALGEKLGCLLLQLPPKLELDDAISECFLRELRERHTGAVAIEPRNAGWFGERAGELLAAHRIARVAADPPRAEADGVPGGSRDVTYHRLHGSPRIYFSAYEPRVLDALAGTLAAEAAAGSDAWCIFDNTGGRAAIPDALYLQRKLAETPKGHTGRHPKERQR